MKHLRRQTARTDRGETLIEALVSISILGLAVVALLGGILIGIKTSVLHRKHAQAQTELRSWGERLGTDPVTGAPHYDDCATAADLVGPPAGMPAGFAGTVTGVTYWDGSAFVANCTPATDRGLQKVTIRITVPPGIHPGFDETLNVIIRKPCAPAC